MSDTAQALLDSLKECSEYRRIDDGIDEGYSYKPLYRCLALMCAPGKFRREHLEDKIPTLAEAEALLRATHSFFNAYIDKYRDNFQWHYENMVEVWS
jgi:hypothetical protein